MGSEDAGLRPLAAFDIEGCLTRAPTVWERMHKKNNTWQTHGKAYYQKYLAGMLHYDDFARMDVMAWRGAAVDMLYEAADEVEFMPGCRTLLDRLKKEGFDIVLISNGLMCLARRFVAEFDVSEVYANWVVVKDGRLTGDLKLEVPYNSKGEILLSLMVSTGLDKSAVVSVGDSSSDIAMFEKAHTAIAISPVDSRVRKAATHVIDMHDLSACADLIINAR